MIYMFLAEGFEETEALAPLDILRRAGLQVTTVGIGSKTVMGAHGIPITADVTEEALSFTSSSLDAVILPGGMPGTTNLDASKTVHAAVDSAAECGALIGAICAAPMILGKKGLLDGKAAICYPGFEQHLKGALISDKKVVRDGNIITAKGMGVAVEFGLALTSALKGKDISENIRSAIMSD